MTVSLVTLGESATSEASHRPFEPYSGLTMQPIFRSFAFCILAAWAPLYAADNINARWSDLCHVASGHKLNITTSDGKTVSGSCASTDADGLSLKSNQQVIKIARATLTRIQMYQPGNGHHLADLGNGMSKSFRRGFGWLFSPAAPLGLITIPATVAWGAVSAPFCLLGDLGDNGPTTQDIKVTD